jgi:hypothetical protein
MSPPISAVFFRFPANLTPSGSVKSSVFARAEMRLVRISIRRVKLRETYSTDLTVTGTSVSSPTPTSRRRRDNDKSAGSQFFRISITCVSRMTTSLHPSSRYWCHSSGLIQSQSWLFIPGMAFVVNREGSDLHRIDAPVAESSAVSLREPFREHHHKPAPAAGCAGERKGKSVTIDKFVHRDDASRLSSYSDSVQPYCYSCSCSCSNGRG